MKCSNCKKTIRPQVNFCAYCGAEDMNRISLFPKRVKVAAAAVAAVLVLVGLWWWLVVSPVETAASPDARSPADGH